MHQANSFSLLKEGVVAAKAGDKLTARALLHKATELNPENEMAWFWLAYVAETPYETILHLRRVLKINPFQDNARSVLKRVLLQQGIALAKGGKKVEGRSLLLEASEMDAGNEIVWFWLASVAQSPQEAIVYIEKVLEINPSNERALMWLTRLRLQVATPAPSWHCPLCNAAAAAETERCPKCRAVLEISDLDSLLQNNEVDVELVQAAIERLRRSAAENPGYENIFHLGLAYLNLRQMHEGVAALREASRLNPDDDLLQSVVEALLRRQQEETAAAGAEAFLPEEEPSAQPDSAQKVILLVDDSPTVRKIVAVTLERRGHRVLVAPGAMEAMAKLQEVVPDLILMDINMPHMDGYQLCKLVKGNEGTKDVPIIMLSGKDGFLDKVRGRMSGATSYITKPFEPATLLDAVERYCGQSRQAG
ncbi:MAG TPA: response regulator [Blastocatellia bacterium]|nr:response regulator [Blastocatellia bacterium]